MAFDRINKMAKLSNWKFLLIGIVLIALIITAIAGFAVAEDQQSFEDELNNLIQDLENTGFGWLVDYVAG